MIPERKPIEPLDPAVYARVFEGHHEGVLILEELWRVFAARSMFASDADGGERETSRRIGKREVLEFIVSKINRSRGIDDDTPTATEETAP